ncbi:peptidase S8/S53 domain-containing protein [Coniella lustricola]|uniref:tripeptidyl-peptidase II n=1 Tax=Coniella lustricola TaxID=2025994 RepID=A0A2T3A081_9PEZI|nr:peptidase S8/S53 domain-containing protein [Coniella lustricola]
MWSSSLLVLASLAVVGSASPAAAPSHVVHEKRDKIPSGWQARDRVEGHIKMPLRVGLKQRNLDMGPSYLDEVSNPHSSKYGQHWSADEIIDMFAPSQDSVDSVTSWLAEAGIASDRISHHFNKGWVEVQDSTVAELEQLLQTEYYYYDHKFGQSHVACEAYSIPSHLSQDHVDMITPTLHFDVPVRPNKDELQRKRRKRDLPSLAANNTASLPKPGAKVDMQTLSTDLADCDTSITIDCLRALYNITTGTYNLSSYGIVEYGFQSYLGSDLDLFFANYSTDLVGLRPTLASVDGGAPQSLIQNFDFNGESDLDLEYSMTLVYPQQVTLFQTGDDEESASFNNFLDAIDASYCTYDGGDVPGVDGTYPDEKPGGYKSQDCGIYAPPDVISTSYGTTEASFTIAYAQRQCYEYMKLGLAGVTVLYSSGDDGVAGNGECLDDGVRFNPTFPGTCPYVTSVGATQVPTGTDITTSLASGTQPETACETVIYSGGGFSNYFNIPSYQADAVNTFLTDYPPPYTARRYNNTGTSRAFPDVSANGANYVLAIDGEWEYVYGTSASSPVFGSIISLINNELAAAGKSPVGFINPTLYAYPDVLNDVTEGTNEGCSTDGFSSQPGWDPVTGLGTPNYPAMLELFLSLQ